MHKFLSEDLSKLIATVRSLAVNFKKAQDKLKTFKGVFNYDFVDEK